MRPRTAALAVALSLAVLGAAVAVGRFALVRHAEERAAHEERGTPVLAFDPARAVAVRLVSGSVEVRLERRGGRGWVSVPGGVPADPRAVGALLDRLAALRRRATSAGAGLAPERLRPYGLDAPRRRIAVGLDDGRVETLAIGLTTEGDGITFVMPTSGDVAIVSADARADLERAADAAAGGARVPAGPAP
jgi:Domain of unknown function (DUF4340)